MGPNMLSKKDAKPHFIPWVLLLQELELEIWDKKGSKNVVADYLSWLITPSIDEEDLLLLNESFERF